MTKHFHSSMRVICDILGHTCNRFWTYVASIAQCITEHKRIFRPKTEITLKAEGQQFSDSSFSKIVDFFHFENGKEIFDW